MPSLTQFIVWIIVGLIGGSLTGFLITWERGGFGFLRNLGVGLVGALVGGFIFRLFGLLPDLDKIAISLRDIVAALAGSLPCSQHFGSGKDSRTSDLVWPVGSHRNVRSGQRTSLPSSPPASRQRLRRWCCS